ncbi:MAG: hypothetical protein ABJN40_01715 [Sneathiella sp.]
MIKFQARAKEGMQVYIWGGAGLKSLPSFPSSRLPLFYLHIPDEGETVEIYLADEANSKSIGELGAGECLCIPIVDTLSGIYVSCNSDTVINCEILY